MEQSELEQQVLFEGEHSVDFSSEPVGVGGWLLYVCVMMTIISPIITVGGDLGALNKTPGLLHRTSGWGTYYLFLFGIDAMKIAFSIYAGTGLWRLRKNAVEIAILCFLALPFYPISAWIVGTALTHGASQFHTKNFLQGLGAAVVWISYLQLSRRVRNTYSRRESAQSPIG